MDLSEDVQLNQVVYFYSFALLTWTKYQYWPMKVKAPWPLTNQRLWIYLSCQQRWTEISVSFFIYTKPKNNQGNISIFNKTRIGILPTLSLNWETKPILSFFTSLSNNIIWAQKISEQNIPMPSLVVTVTYNYHSQNGTFAK